MKNKFKLGLFVVIMFSVFSFVGFANAADLSFPVDTTVEIGGHDYIIKAGSTATTMVVGATNITITVPDGSVFYFASPDKYNLDNDGELRLGCSATESLITIDGPKTAIVITPDINQGCSVSSGGSSGGSKAKPKTTPPAVVTPTPTPTPITYEGEACSYNLGMATLKNGSKGEAVKELQRFLNATMNLGLVVDGALGPKTIAVMMKWQTENGLASDGLIGPMTKAKINGIAAARCGNSATPATPGETPATPNAQGYAFGTLTVKEGTKGEACKAWQNFLNDKTNAGLVADGNCGPKTIQAVKAWQASVGLTADGFLGAMSRAKALAQ